MDHGDERFGACLTHSTIFSSQSSACICCFPPKTLTEVSNVFPSSVKHLHVSTPVVFLSHHSVHSLPLLSFALVCLFTCNRLKLLSRIYRISTVSSACVCLEIKPQNTRNTFNFLLIGVMKDCNISISRLALIIIFMLQIFWWEVFTIAVSVTGFDFRCVDSDSLPSHTWTPFPCSSYLISHSDGWVSSHFCHTEHQKLDIHMKTNRCPSQLALRPEGWVFTHTLLRYSYF